MRACSRPMACSSRAMPRACWIPGATSAFAAKPSTSSSNDGPHPNPLPEGRGDNRWTGFREGAASMKREEGERLDDLPNRYFDPHFKVETAKILPGEYYA